MEFTTETKTIDFLTKILIFNLALCDCGEREICFIYRKKERNNLIYRCRSIRFKVLFAFKTPSRVSCPMHQVTATYLWHLQF